VTRIGIIRKNKSRRERWRGRGWGGEFTIHMIKVFIFYPN
jgi:hypothetical protein